MSELIFKLAQNNSKRVQIAKIGSFDHEIYGKFSITLNDLQEMKTNFYSNVRKQKIEGNPVIPFDYGHYDEEKAAGWITELSIEKDSHSKWGLFAEVKWTPTAVQKIKDGEFKFVSPLIHNNYKDAETKKTYKTVLMGAALTNIPFLRDMEAIHLLSEDRRKAFESLKLSGDSLDQQSLKGKKMAENERTAEFNEILNGLESISSEDKKILEDSFKADTKKLSEENKKLLSEEKKKFKAENEKLKKNAEKTPEDLKLSDDKLKLAEGKIEKLEENLSSMTQTMAENKRTTEFNQMLSEGKVCEAQRKSFMKQDFTEFAKKTEEIKLKEVGHSKDDNKDEKEASGKLVKLAEEKVDKEKISFGESMKVILSENPKLAAQAGQ